MSINLARLRYSIYKIKMIQTLIKSFGFVTRSNIIKKTCSLTVALQIDKRGQRSDFMTPLSHTFDLKNWLHFVLNRTLHTKPRSQVRFISSCNKKLQPHYFLLLSQTQCIFLFSHFKQLKKVNSVCLCLCFESIQSSQFSHFAVQMTYFLAKMTDFFAKNL